MTVRVGIIGAGMIGTDHARRLSETVPDAQVVAVTDVDADRAAQLADSLPKASPRSSGEELVADPDVDAVLIASWGGTHEQYTLAAIEATKPVFCEKPLATTLDACLRIIEAETRYGRRLVQVGFMRRYDLAYRQLKATLNAGRVGVPLLMHCAHRISSVAPTFTSEMMVNDAAVHELDLVRWLFDSDLVEVRAVTPRHNPSAPSELADPLLLNLRLANGVAVDVEVSASMGSGYDIRGEVVGSEGSVSLADTGLLDLRATGQTSTPLPADWRARFVEAYDREIVEWVAGVARGAEATGPSSWDGLAAAAAADSSIEAMRTGEAVVIDLPARPDLYR